MGLERLTAALLKHLVRPLAQHLFPRDGGARLDWAHGYVVGYAPERAPGVTRSALDPHTDDSEVTLSVNLGRDFTGGVVEFGHRRGTPKEEQHMCKVPLAPGKAILHPGRQLHTVHPVTGGQRFNLIVWTRCWNGVRDTTCPCCWFNDRPAVQSKCVCGPVWN
eukprot:TRINITY_DN18333_c0_g1_i1.p2 TRINITY_DN18333_c0_g1~~TRINITY_DN18333_c0_g1_i1.p2  ORF type:complete len:173 (-),score=32.19 TRINITY_DN18333_c0_g1_i1:9-497(-)